MLCVWTRLQPGSTRGHRHYGETVEMCGLWEGIQFPITTGSSSAQSHCGETVHLLRLWEGIHPILQTSDTPPHSHRGEAIHLPCVWEGIHSVIPHCDTPTFYSGTFEAILHSAAHVVIHSKFLCPITPVLSDLYWLPLNTQPCFQIRRGSPTSLTPPAPQSPRYWCCSNSGLLSIFYYNCSTTGGRVFSSLSPKL